MAKFKPRKGVVPPHLRRFLFKRKAAHSSVRAKTHQVKYTMARRSGRRRSGSMGGFSTGRLLKGALVGIGASMLVPAIGQNDILRAGAGFVLAGGLPGAAAAFAAPKIMPMVTGAASTSSSQAYG